MPNILSSKIKTTLPQAVMDIINKIETVEAKETVFEWAIQYQQQFGDRFDEKDRDLAFNKIRILEKNQKIFNAVISIQNIILKEIDIIE